MSKPFVWMNRPKKPSEDGRLSRDLWNCMSVVEFNEQVALFMKEHAHLKLEHISIEFDNENYEYSLEAAGKSHAQYMKEMAQYKRDMKKYNDWRADNREAIIAFKESEKRRIAKAKLQRTTDRLKKELAAIEAKQKRLIEETYG